MPDVVVDTNCAHSESSIFELLGNREELSEITEIATLLIPDIVIDELIQQKRRLFEKMQREFTNHRFIKLTGSDVEQFKQMSFENYEKDLREDQSICFETLSFEPNGDLLERARKLAITNAAPFEKDSDKGIKDYLIACEIEQYVKKRNSKDTIYVLSRDDRLTLYLDSLDGVKVISNSKDLKDELFGSKNGESIEDSPTQSEDQTPKAMQPSTAKKEIRDLLTTYESSGSYQETHSVVSQLSPLVGELSDDDFHDILVFTVNNDQILWIIKDQDVYDFVLPIFRKYGSTLTDEQYATFVEAAGIIGVRDQQGDIAVFEDEDLDVYRAFSRELTNHIKSIDTSATLQNDCTEILQMLRKASDDNCLEEVLPDCKVVIDAFVTGKYRYYPHRFSVATLTEFKQLLEKSSPSQARTVVKNIASALSALVEDEYEGDIPF